MPVPTCASLFTRKCFGRSSFARKLSTIWIIESPVATTVLPCAGAANARRPTATAATRRFTSEKLSGGAGHDRGFGLRSYPAAHDHLGPASGQHHNAAHAHALVLGPSRSELDARQHLAQDHLHLEAGEGRADAAPPAAPERDPRVRRRRSLEEALRAERERIGPEVARVPLDEAARREHHRAG